MKRIFILSALLMTGLSLAQVGINTTDPKATLEVASKSANDVGDVEGILIPRVSKQKALLMAGNTTTPVEESTMIYVNNLTDFTDPADGSEAAVSDITENGYYHWNGSKWVKVVGKNGELWTEITTQGGADYVNLKAAELNNDTIAYNSTNRHFYINLGNGDSSEDMWSDGAFGLPLNEIPKLSIVTSDVLPTESHIGSTGLSTGGYRFSSDVFLVHDEHANRNNNTSSNLKSYLGNSIRTIIPRGLTSPNIRSITGGEFASMSRSNISVGSITGGASVAINGADGVTQGEVDLLKGLNTWISNSGIAKSMLGSEVSVRNWGKAENIKGIRINTISQLSDTGLIPSHEVKRIYGIDNVTSISPNATVSEYARGFSNYLSVGEGANMSNTFYGAKNDVDIKENVILNRDLFGLQNTISIDSEVTMQPGKRIYVSWDALDVKSNLVDADVFVDRNAFKLSADNSSARHVNLNQSVMYSTAPSVTDLTGTFSAYSFWNANKENWTANKMYGVYLDPIINGQTANYGIYMENVGNTTSQNNYSIYTNAGKLRFGDLAGTGERIVTADADGVLATSSVDLNDLGIWRYNSQDSRIVEIENSAETRLVNITSDEMAEFRMYSNSELPLVGGGINTIRGRGTYENRTGVLDGDNLGNFGMGGYDSAENVYNSSGIFAFAKGDWSTTNHSSNIVFRTTNGLQRSSKMVIASDGKVGIGTMTPSEILDVAGNVRATSLAGTGERIVTADADGVLGTSNISTLAEWNDATLTRTLEDGSTEDYDIIYAKQANDNGNNIVITDDGRLGVGTVDPRGNFSVDGSAFIDNYLQIDGTTSTDWLFTGVESSGRGLISSNMRYKKDKGWEYVNGTSANNEGGWVLRAFTPENTNTMKFPYVLSIGNQDPTIPGQVATLSNALRVDYNGNVGVGQALNDLTEKLEVAGNVKADAFYAAAAGNYFPDYVFDAYYNGESKEKADYNFKSLDTVESFIKENGHLPGYVSAKEVAEAGQFDMTATQLTNVEKIEELYLHTIEQEAKIKAQKEELQEKDAKIKALEARLERIEKLLEK